MNDESGGSLQARLRRAHTIAQHTPRPGGRFVRGLLWVGIALCLLVVTVCVTNKSSSGIVEVSTVEFSTGDLGSDDADSGNIFEDSLVDPRLILGTEMPVIYGVDLEEVYLDENMDAPDRPEINFDVLPEDIKLEILRFSDDAPKQFDVGEGGPQILIYHTHTREAYLETDESIYDVGQYQTTDQTHSVVAVGEVLKTALESYGFNVIHDVTDHVPPRQGTAYVRSLQTMLEYQQQYPTLRVFIDLHRDAYGDIEAGSKDYVTVSGQACARVMCVVGTGESFDENEKPNYESNYKLALAFTNEMEGICEKFTRPIRVKANRYNQNVSDMCLLIEVGHNANTLEQAKNSAKYIAQALSHVVDIGSP